MCINDQNPNPLDELPPIIHSRADERWQHQLAAPRAHWHAARACGAVHIHHISSAVLDVLDVAITLRLGNLLKQTQRFDAHHDRADGTTEGKMCELVISCLSPHFFTLLILAGDAPMTLQ